MAASRVLEARAERRVGSSPTFRTFSSLLLVVSCNSDKVITVVRFYQRGLRDCVTVARKALNLLVWVRILVPELLILTP